MPIVQVSIMQGRPPERIEAMITAVSHAVADTLDAPIETVRVLVREMEDHQYGVGGKPIRVVQEERARAAAGAGGPTDS